MKLVVAIVHNEDAGALVDALLDKEFRATRVSQLRRLPQAVERDDPPGRRGRRCRRGHGDRPRHVHVADPGRQPDAADHGAGRVLHALPARGRGRRRDRLRRPGRPLRAALAVAWAGRRRPSASAARGRGRSRPTTSRPSRRSPATATRCISIPTSPARTRPGALIVHGGLTTGLFNALVAEVLPGPGSVFLHQEWDYPAPAFIGDTVTAEAEVIDARADKPITTLRCVARRADGTEVLRGDLRRLHDDPGRRPRDDGDERDRARRRRAEPAERWVQLAILGVGMVLAMSPSFAAAAVAPILREEWSVGPLDLPFLTVVVQLGFAVGAIGLAVIGAPDVIPGPRLFAAGAIGRGDREPRVRARRDRPRVGDPVPVPDRRGARRRLPGRDEARRGLVPARPRPGDRRGQRRANGRRRPAVPVPGDRRVCRRRLAAGRRRSQRRGRPPVPRSLARPADAGRSMSPAPRFSPAIAAAAFREPSVRLASARLLRPHVGAVRDVDVDPDLPPRRASPRPACPTPRSPR